MQQTALHQFPAFEVEYEFRCRNESIDFTHCFKDVYRAVKEELPALRFTDDDLNYLNNLGFFKSDYLEFLRLFRFNPKMVDIELGQEGQLHICVHGPWVHTILYEVPILAIVNELYFRNFPDQREVAIQKLETKVEELHKIKRQWANFKFAEFGTRRRYSHDWQNYVIKRFVNYDQERKQDFYQPAMIGTSNVFFARLWGLKPIGTMAHEFFQAGQASGVQLVDSQRHMLDAWVREYRGDLGIALTDIIGIDYFLMDFDLFFAKLYDGVRHDSGDPFVFGEKMLLHYEELGISTKDKQLIFSDGLNFRKAGDLHGKFQHCFNVSFGIGTWLTNDTDLQPLNIVLKMTKSNNKPVAKISDSPGKGMCKDEEFVSYLKKVFNDRLERKN